MCISGDEESADGATAETDEDPTDSGFITRMFDKVATSALGPSSLPTKVTPHHFQVTPSPPPPDSCPSPPHLLPLSGLSGCSSISVSLSVYCFVCAYVPV